MSFAEAMLRTHPATPANEEILATCIRACFACAQACTSCADACLGEPDPKMLDRCIRLDLDCADLCQATGNIVTRQTKTDLELVSVTLRACSTACRLCAEECEEHAAMAHCRVCAEACRECERACDDLVAQIAA
jgi:hypothetical protein